LGLQAGQDGLDRGAAAEFVHLPGAVVLLVHHRILRAVPGLDVEVLLLRRPLGAAGPVHPGVPGHITSFRKNGGIMAELTVFHSGNPA